MNNTLKQHAQTLHLSGLLESLELRLQEAEANRLPYAQFLELLFQDEINVRHQRRVIGDAVVGNSQTRAILFPQRRYIRSLLASRPWWDWPSIMRRGRPDSGASTPTSTNFCRRLGRAPEPRIQPGQTTRPCENVIVYGQYVLNPDDIR
jgi:hypothetical protein